APRRLRRVMAHPIGRWTNMRAIDPCGAPAAGCGRPAALPRSACTPAGSPAVDCHVGAYRLADGALVDVAPVSDPEGLRWRLPDGRTGRLAPAGDGAWTSTLGWTGRPDGVQVSFGECGAGRIAYDGREGERLAFEATDTTFEGADVTLAGRLVLPPGDGPVPIVVEVHGSEDYSARMFNTRRRTASACPSTTSAAPEARAAATARTSNCCPPTPSPPCARHAAWPARGPAASGSSAAARPAGSRRWRRARSRWTSWPSAMAWPT